MDPETKRDNELVTIQLRRIDAELCYGVLTRIRDIIRGGGKEHEIEHNIRGVYVLSVQEEITRVVAVLKDTLGTDV